MMKYIGLLFLIIVSHFSYAKQQPLQVAVNIGQPWAFYETDKGATGIDVEIIRRALTRMNYQAEFYVLTYKRLIKDFNDGKYDIASPAAFDAKNGYFRLPYLPFMDVAITSANSPLEITSIEQLENKRIVAYQHATSVLGPIFKTAVANASYIEMADRKVQLKLLAFDRSDVVIGERRLLEYINQRYYPDHPIKVHAIFPPKSYGAVFKDQQLQQQFDNEINKMRADGEYQEILARWP